MLVAAEQREGVTNSGNVFHDLRKVNYNGFRQRHTNHSATYNEAPQVAHIRTVRAKTAQSNQKN